MATEYGDFAGFLSGNQKGEDNTLNGIDNEDNTLIGDVDDITDEAQGGDDELTGGDNSGGGTVFNELSDDEAGESFMSRHEEKPSSHLYLPQIDETSAAIASAGEQMIESVATSMVTAQFELLALMSQCALAWVTLPVRMAAICSEDEYEQQQVFLGNGAKIFSQAATISGATSHAAPMITGFEETLNDQFNKPRPHEVQQRDMLILWERSNEFELIHGPANLRASESHSQSY